MRGAARRRLTHAERVRRRTCGASPRLRWTSGTGTGRAAWNEIRERAQAHQRAALELPRPIELRRGEAGRSVKFFFPDSQDQVDPSFDFVTEERRRIGFASATTSTPTRCSRRRRSTASCLEGDRRRLTAAPAGTPRPAPPALPRGVREFFRLDAAGDRGSRRWATAARSPTSTRRSRPTRSTRSSTSTSECGFDLGISVDHVILGYHDRRAAAASRSPTTGSDRQEFTLELAAEFLRAPPSAGCRLRPVGVAQGWSPGVVRRGRAPTPARSATSASRWAGWCR